MDSSLSKLTHDIEESKNIHTEEISKYENQLTEIKEKVNKETEKLKLPNQLIDSREKELSKKENNFLILTLRWKKLFKKMFPNQEFKY